MTGAKGLFLLNRYVWIASYMSLVIFDQWTGAGMNVRAFLGGLTWLLTSNRHTGVRSHQWAISECSLIALSSSCSRLGSAGNALAVLHNLVVSGPCQPSLSSDDSVHAHVQALRSSISDLAGIRHQRSYVAICIYSGGIEQFAILLINSRISYFPHPMPAWFAQISISVFLGPFYLIP